MIFPLFYFGPVSYYAKLMQSENYKFEIHENFPKQTFRNRCYIMGANGKLRLGIPTLHDGSRTFKDIKISYDFPWQKEHAKSIISAYKSSPYFEYYEDELIPILENKEKFLFDLNLKTLEFISAKLKLNLNFDFTENYQLVDEKLDFRNSFSAKVEPQIDFPTYMQVFDDKLEFLPDLSIIDLLCNEGPKSTTYLQKLIIN